MRICVRLTDLPEAIRADALARGIRRGPRVDIAIADLQAISRPAGNARVAAVVFPEFRLRSDLEQSLLLTICGACPRQVNGRCQLCRSCGGGIPVADWVKLSNHRCPEKKW